MVSFEILIDCPFRDISTLVKESELSHLNNGYVRGLLNDFENGSWRLDKFENFVWDNIKETALSKKERDALQLNGEMSTLKEAAKNLRLLDKDDSGGEIAEIVLYGIMRHYYNALPVVPKIFYKQNKNDFAKGADSVHITLEDGKFFIWYGEAKFYNDISDSRLQTVVDSVNNTLQLDKLKKENSIICNVSDLAEYVENKDTLSDITNILGSSRSIDDLKPHLHIPIMLLYECDITSKETHLTDSYKRQIKDAHTDRANAYFKKQIATCSGIDMYDYITFHLILLPAPNKEKIVERFKNQANVLRG